MLSAIQMGGAERVLIRLLPHLARAGVVPTVCTVTDVVDPDLDDELAATGVARMSLGARRAFDPGGWWRLRRLLVSDAFDVVHTHDSQSQTVAGFVGRTTRMPVIMTRHVIADDVGRRRGRGRARAARWAARVGATEVVAVSDAVGDRVRAETGLSRQRVRTIYNGIDTEHFSPHAGGASGRGPGPGARTRPTLAMIAVMRPEKGHAVLLDALVRLRARVPDVALQLVGTGYMEPTLRARAAAMGDAVDFLGVLHDVRPVLEASDVVVLPSQLEALPTVLLEAGAMGRPVVATRVGGIPEIVEDGRTGLLVDVGDPDALADQLAQLLLDPPRARAMGCAARARVKERFSLPVQAAALRALYDEVSGVR
jgi:glycosyltransferase involved in cell wall biosynthesis